MNVGDLEYAIYPFWYTLPVTAIAPDGTEFDVASVVRDDHGDPVLRLQEMSPES